MTHFCFPPPLTISSARIISVRPLPAATIGNTLAPGSMMKSMNTRSILVLGEGLAQGRLDVFRLLDAHADVAVGLGQLDEIGQRGDVGLRVALGVEHLLPLADHAEHSRCSG